MRVYRATYQRVADKNRAFFTRFPMPRPWPTGWPTTCTTTTCACPTASALTVEQLQQQGAGSGASGAFEALYYLLEDAFIGERLNPAFLYQVQAMQPFNTNPVFAILHELIYCEGSASNWAAERVRRSSPSLAWAPGKISPSPAR